MRYVLLSLAVWTTVAARAGDLIHAEGPGGVQRTYEGDLGGLRAYVADLKAMEPGSARLLESALHRIEQKEERATIAASAQAFAGGAIFLSSFTFLREPTANGTHRMRASAAVFGVGLMAAALVVYDMLAPKRADILEFVNAHNEGLPVRPLRLDMDPSIPYVPQAQAAGVTIPF